MNNAPGPCGEEAASESSGSPRIRIYTHKNIYS